MITNADYNREGNSKFTNDMWTLFSDIINDPRTVIKHILKFCTKYRDPFSPVGNDVYFSGYLLDSTDPYVNQRISKILAEYQRPLPIMSESIKPVKITIRVPLSNTGPVDDVILTIIEKSLADLKIPIVKNKLLGNSIGKVIDYLRTIRDDALPVHILKYIDDNHTLLTSTTTPKGLKEILAFSTDTLVTRFNEINTISVSIILDTYIISQIYLKKNLDDEVLKKFTTLQETSLKTLVKIDLFKYSFRDGIENMALLLGYWRSMPVKIDLDSTIIVENFSKFIKDFNIARQYDLEKNILLPLTDTYVHLANIDTTAIPDPELGNRIQLSNRVCG